ncbi:sensor histidine kinase [Marinobacterium aestuariivivens]|uniref:histidine kinase n=1 Tax=Marinobacterium aestuariivivens TaxID=1698799 RepID=A0ABW2A066_9GAMM
MIWNRMLQREVASRTEELRQHQLQLIQADKMTSLGILVSGVAHEINNPCSLLLLNLPVLRDAYHDAREVLEEHYQSHGDFELGGLEYSRMRDEIPLMLDEMLEGTQRIKRIVGDLKDFARQGDAELNESLDLNQVVRTAIRLVDNSIRSATGRFEVDYGSELPAVRGNGQRIEQVVINLILNACQALQSTEQGIFLHTRFHPETGRVLLEVRDQGCGIDAESMSRLTDPFFTTRRECGGTGLGLSVSAGIVREHGGSLDFESTPGQGTRVTLALPALAEGEADAVLSAPGMAG